MAVSRLTAALIAATPDEELSIVTFHDKDANRWGFGVHRIEEAPSGFKRTRELIESTAFFQSSEDAEANAWRTIEQIREAERGDQ